jgi:hypothetical protein
MNLSFIDFLSEEEDKEAKDDGKQAPWRISVGSVANISPKRMADAITKNVYLQSGMKQGGETMALGVVKIDPRKSGVKNFHTGSADVTSMIPDDESSIYYRGDRRMWNPDKIKKIKGWVPSIGVDNILSQGFSPPAGAGGDSGGGSTGLDASSPDNPFAGLK